MARTLWGNILETLAQTGIQTAANVGGNLLLQPMRAKQDAQSQVLKGLLPAMGIETDPNKLSYIAQKIKELSGVDLATGVPETNPAGYEGRMGDSALTIPKSTNLMELAPGVATTPGFIRPPVSQEHIMGGLLSKMSPEQQQQIVGLKTGAGIKPIDALKLALGERRLNQQDDQYRQTQDRMTQQFQQTQERINQQNESMQELRKQGLALALKNQQDTHGLMKDRLESGAMTQLQKSLDAVQKVVKDPMATEGAIKTAMEQYNATHAKITTKYPDLADSFKPLDPELSTGWFGTSVGAGKIKGVKPRETGGNIDTIPNPTQPQITFPITLKNKVTGQTVTVNSKEELQKYQGQ